MTKKTASQTASPDETRQTRGRHWLTMSPEEQLLPGAQLMSWLFQRANEQSLGITGLAAALGVTYGYLHQLRGGTRQLLHISDDFATACARFLCVPRIAVLLAAGRVTAEDFYENPAHVSARVDEALSHIANDPRWAPLIPAEAHTASYEMRRLVVLLYEAATGHTLLPASADVDSLIAAVHAQPDPGHQ